MSRGGAALSGTCLRINDKMVIDSYGNFVGGNIMCENVAAYLHTPVISELESMKGITCNGKLIADRIQTEHIGPINPSSSIYIGQDGKTPLIVDAIAGQDLKELCVMGDLKLIDDNAILRCSRIECSTTSESKIVTVTPGLSTPQLIINPQSVTLGRNTLEVDTDTSCGSFQVSIPTPVLSGGIIRITMYNPHFKRCDDIVFCQLGAYAGSGTPIIQRVETDYEVCYIYVCNVSTTSVIQSHTVLCISYLIIGS
jgi:hypothetical protein